MITAAELREVLEGVPDGALIDIEFEGHCCDEVGFLRSAFVDDSGGVTLSNGYITGPVVVHEPAPEMHGPPVPNRVAEHEHDLLCPCKSSTHWPSRCTCTDECFN